MMIISQDVYETIEKYTKCRYDGIFKDEGWLNDEEPSYLISDEANVNMLEDLVYEIMLKYGIDLTLPIEEHDNIYSIGFNFYHNSECCFYSITCFCCDCYCSRFHTSSPKSICTY